MKDYNTELELRLDWSEMDLFGHINNVSFFKYIQAARVNYWEHTGLTQMHRQTGTGPMLASTSCQFKQPLFYPGRVKIRSKIGFVKTTSFSIQHIIVNDKDEIAAQAEDIVVLYDFKAQQKRELPQILLEAMEKREQRKLK